MPRRAVSPAPAATPTIVEAHRDVGERTTQLSSIDLAVQAAVSELRAGRGGHRGDSSSAISMHPLTLAFGDESLEDKYRHEEFSRSCQLYLACASILGAILAWQTFRDLRLLTAILTPLVCVTCLARVYFQTAPRQPWRLDGWVCFVFAISILMTAAMWEHGPRANGMLIIKADDNMTESLVVSQDAVRYYAMQYAMQCVIHVTFYFVCILAVFTDAAFKFYQKALLSCFFLVGQATTGGITTSPTSPTVAAGDEHAARWLTLDASVSILTSFIGGALGFAVAHLMEHRSREAFLHALNLQDSMIIWRAIALTNSGSDADDLHD